MSFYFDFTEKIQLFYVEKYVSTDQPFLRNVYRIEDAHYKQMFNCFILFCDQCHVMISLVNFQH
jgi:hypothetical protein